MQDARDDLVKQFASPGELQERMARVGLTSDKLNEILEQRVRIDKYLDFRFRSFIVITQKDIADYYRDVYVAAFQESLSRTDCEDARRKHAKRSKRP